MATKTRRTPVPRYVTRAFRKKTHRKAKPTLSLGIVAGFIPPGVTLYNEARKGMGNFAYSASKMLTGYESDTGKWSPRNMIPAYAPIFGGFLAHMVASKLGINRMIARSGIPFVRI